MNPLRTSCFCTGSGREAQCETLASAWRSRACTAKKRERGQNEVPQDLAGENKLLKFRGLSEEWKLCACSLAYSAASSAAFSCSGSDSCLPRVRSRFKAVLVLGLYLKQRDHTLGLVDGIDRLLAESCLASSGFTGIPPCRPFGSNLRLAGCPGIHARLKRKGSRIQRGPGQGGHGS